jgi:MurNAc alpha-1-phosphate uridylyltransferase
VVNIAWLEERFIEALGDGSALGLRIHWSREGRDHGRALETAGGIRKALPLLADCFWVLSADVYVPDMVFDADPMRHLPVPDARGALWMVPNPPHHPRGDFGMGGDGPWLHAGEPRMTWGSVGVFRADLFEGLPEGQPLPLRPVLDAAIARRQLAGLRLPGCWVDVGTEARLAAARADAAARGA